MPTVRSKSALVAPAVIAIADGLHHFRGVIAYYVRADHALARLIHHKLHHRTPLAAAEHVAHRHEFGDIYIDRASFRGVFFREAACADRWDRKNRGGDGIERPTTNMFAE